MAIDESRLANLLPEFEEYEAGYLEENSILRNNLGDFEATIRDAPLQ